MSRPHLSVMGVIYEALGFATSKFGTALRVAWLPLVLIMLLEVVLGKLGLYPQGVALALPIIPEQGWITNFAVSAITVPFVGAPVQQAAIFLGALLIAAILQTSFMVPLIREAAGVERHHHRSMHLAFGPRHVGYLLASALSFGVILVGAQFLLVQGQKFVGTAVSNQLSQTQPTFTGDSLHSIEQVSTYEGVNTVLNAIDVWLREIGINLSSVDAIVVLPVTLIGLYVVLRLIAWPALVAAGRGNLGTAMNLTGGGNILPTIAIAALYLLLLTVFLVLTSYGVRFIFAYLSSGSEYLISGYEGFVSDGDAATWIRGLLVTMFGAIVLAVNTFVAAFQAGLGGALVHRARGA